MVITGREVAAAIVAHIDGISNIDAYLSSGPHPPRGRTVVIHPDPGQHDGPLGDPDRDLRVEFQTTCIGETPEQALWTHDQVSARLWRSVLQVGAATTHPIWAVLGSQQPVRRDDALADTWYLVTCSWVAHTRPGGN